MSPTATDPTLWRQVTLPASVKHLRAQLDEPQWQDLPPPGLAVELHGVGLARGGHSVLRDLHLHVTPGEFVAVVGRSGTGKSRLLRLIAGLDQPHSGKLTLDGAPPAQHRHALRLVFQHPRLLPWKRVIDNVALGLPPAAARAMALDALAQVGMADRARDWPTGLSGGQRQRVALARALVHRPRLLLMDEPLGALDAPTRHAWQALIERLWLQHRFTAVLVTHDLDEAVTLGDRIVLLESGRVALNERQRLARPRRHDDPAFAAAAHALRHRVLHGA